MKKTLLLMMMCVPVLLAAQNGNGVAVSGLAVDAGTVTFNVSWQTPMPVELWSDSVWVFVDYNQNGVMERLPVTDATASAGTVTKIPGNDKGVWVAGNARSQGSFSATVKLLTAIKNVGGACVYGSNYPPVGKYISASEISFTGTPEYKVVLERSNKSTYTATVGKNESLLIPNGEAALSFTDMTGAPGKLGCIPFTVYDLEVSASGFCEGGTGVTFALLGTDDGASYELYRNGTSIVATLEGTGSAATFSGFFEAGTYTAWTVPGGAFCPAEMNGSFVVSRNSLPTQPTIAKPDDVCLNAGSIVFTTTDYSGSLTWVSNGGGAESGNNVTFNSSATGTKTVIARSAQTYTNAPVCYSAEVTQSANVQALPATPGITVSASTVCLGADIVFRVTSPVNEATYTWSGAAGTASGAGDGTYTVSGATTGTKSVTAYARLTLNGTICQSGDASLSVLVSQPGTNGQSSTPCGCATGTTNCSGTCTTTGTYTTNDGACTGACKTAYVQQRNQCGTVVNNKYSTFGSASCTAGCDPVFKSSCKANAKGIGVVDGSQVGALCSEYAYGYSYYFWQWNEQSVSYFCYRCN